MPFKKITVDHTIAGLANQEAAEDLLGTYFQQDTLQIVGKGQGVNKTDTSVHGITVTEDFGIGDELFLHWQIPQLLDRSLDIDLHMEWAPVTSEVGKVFSLQINISSQGKGTNIGDTGESFTIEDIVVPETALDGFSETFIIPKRLLSANYDDLHIRVKRIASTANDLIGDVALHHASIEYQKHQR